MNLDDKDIENDEDEEDDGRKISEARGILKTKNTPILVSIMKRSFLLLIAIFLLYEYFEFNSINKNFDLLKNSFQSTILIFERNIEILNVKYYNRKKELSAK